MASSSSLPATVSSSSAAAAAAAPPRRRFAVSFPLSSQLKNPLLSLLPSRGLGIRCGGSATAKARLNEVVGGSSGGDSGGPSKPTEETPTSEASDSGPSKRNSPPSPLPDEAVSAFMSQVASLVKLVDSRDIVELHLKQLDCELIIRKREAITLPPRAPVVMMQPPSAPAAMPSPAAAAVASPARASSAPPAAPATAQKAAKPSHPPLKSPMAGTLYGSPGPGQPPFVKVGDKVNKGQVLCIIEAMKLMNEIEADHAGTVVEILVEDGKPVGVDQPLFVIEP